MMQRQSQPADWWLASPQATANIEKSPQVLLLSIPLGYMKDSCGQFGLAVPAVVPPSILATPRLAGSKVWNREGLDTVQGLFSSS